MIDISGGIVLGFLGIVALLWAYGRLLDWGYVHTEWGNRPLWYKLLRGPE